MLKLYNSRHTQPTSLNGRQSLHERTRQTQPPLPNRQTQQLLLTFTVLKDSTNPTTRPTRLTPQPSLTGRQNLLISTQLDKHNDPYQTDKLNNPHLF